jgi:branched-chain amino acid aminotransferase
MRAFSSSVDIDVSKLTITKTTTPKTPPPKDTLTFGSTFTDHMLQIDWTSEIGWEAPVIKPYGPLSIDPAASVLHYALECFEGMKAYKGSKGEIRLFRPDRNMNRMWDSMNRLKLPTFDKVAHLECIKQLVKTDGHWIPEGEGYSLYIRPTGIATHPFLGVGQAKHASMFTILSPVGPYYPDGFKPVTLLADQKHVRAWPGGTGDSKVGSNYGPTIKPQMLAAERGFSQVLWLSKPEGYVTEVGTMNMFVFWRNEDGEDELITAPLDGTILPGVTRQSILDLAREWGEFRVTERPFTMQELRRAIKDGRVHESFGAGTAVVVSPIRGIHFDGEDLVVPLDKDDSSAMAGKLTQRMWDTITGIQYGHIESEWSVVVE